MLHETCRNRDFKSVLIKKVKYEQSLEGGDRFRQVYIWNKSAQAEKTVRIKAYGLASPKTINETSEAESK